MQSAQPLTRRTTDPNVQQNMTEIIEEEQIPGKMCDLCYNSYPEEDFYSLSCGHAFCKQDTEEYL